MSLSSRWKTNVNQALTAVALALAGGNGLAHADCTVPSPVSTTMGSDGNFHMANETRPTTPTSGDSDYIDRACASDWLSQVQSHYDIVTSEWKSGRGFTTPCDSTLMYGRWLAGIWILNWSSPTPASNWGDLSGSVMRWAGNYAAQEFIDIGGRCEYGAFGGTFVATQDDDLAFDQYSRYYKEFAYQETPATRAGTILHESRHASGVSHNGNDGTNPCPARIDSCDEKFSDPAFLTGPMIGGANTYGVAFLMDYVLRGVSATTTQRRSAQRWANYVLANRYDTDPGFRLNADGSTCSTTSQFDNACPSSYI